MGGELLGLKKVIVLRRNETDDQDDLTKVLTSLANCGQVVTSQAGEVGPCSAWLTWTNHTEQINVINVSRIDVVNVINIIGFIKVIISIPAMAQSLILRKKCKEKRIVPGQWQ